MTDNFSRELDIACKAVQLCAALTDRVQKQSLKSNTTVEKWDRSPVTICDFAVQALLTSTVRGSFSNDAFLAEEGADEIRQDENLLNQVWDLVQSVEGEFRDAQLQPPKSRDEIADLIDLGGKNQTSDGKRTWVFDPIDGTVTFLHGQQYAINCVFLVDGKEEVAIIGCPNLQMDSPAASEDLADTDDLGLMVFAVHGQGTWVRQMQAGSELAPATKVNRPVGRGLIWTDCSTYTSTIPQLQQQVAARLDTPWPGVDLYSSLMKYAALGLGRADVCIRIFKYGSWKSNMWDHAGGVLIYEEAGGKVTDLDGKAIDFTTGRKMSGNNGLVCAPAEAHDHVLEVIRKVLDSHGPIPWSK